MRLKKIHAVAARLLNEKVANDGIVHIAERNQVPPLRMAVEGGIQIVLAVHPQRGVANSAKYDIGNPVAPEKAIRPPFHRAGFCPDDNAVFKYQFDIRRHNDRFNQPLRNLPVDSNPLRA